MKKYEEYQPSAVEWLDEVPVHWKLKRLKQLTTKIGSGVTPSGGSESYQESGIPLFRSQNVHSDGLRLDDVAFISYEVHESMKNSQVEYDDVLLNITGASIGRCYFYKGESKQANVNQHVCIIRSNGQIIPQYLQMILASNLGQHQIDMSQNGASREGLTFGQLKDFLIPVPPLPEQRAIAAYLDHKTAQLDTLLAQKEALLRMLHQKRQALINEAVTQGLDPSAPRKPSGVAWLGDVPAHWEVKRLKHLLSNDKYAVKTGPFGSQLKSDDLSDDGEIKVITQRNVLDNDFEKGASFVSEDKFESLKSFLIEAGDILFTTRGTIGKAAVMPLLSERAILHPCLIKATINHDLLSKDWLLAFVNDSSYFVEGVRMESNSTVIDVIYSGTLKEVVLPVPPLSEQNRIMLELHKKFSTFDEAAAAIHTQIQTLKAYRQSLISEVVTGKVDVRPAALTPVAAGTQTQLWG